MDSLSKQSQNKRNIQTLIEEYLKGPGTTQRKFCQDNKIALSTFQFHLRKYRRHQSGANSEPDAHFIPLTLTDHALPSSNHSECEISWPNGLNIRFRVTPDTEYLLALIKAGTQRI